jgi:hypothetical protein
MGRFNDLNYTLGLFMEVEIWEIGRGGTWRTRKLWQSKDPQVICEFITKPIGIYQ